MDSLWTVWIWMRCLCSFNQAFVSEAFSMEDKQEIRETLDELHDELQTIYQRQEAGDKSFKNSVGFLSKKIQVRRQMHPFVVI